jgi:hypothetical protein
MHGFGDNVQQIAVLAVKISEIIIIIVNMVLYSPSPFGRGARGEGPVEIAKALSP